MAKTIGRHIRIDEGDWRRIESLAEARDTNPSGPGERYYCSAIARAGEAAASPLHREVRRASNAPPEPRHLLPLAHRELQPGRPLATVDPRI